MITINYSDCINNYYFLQDSFLGGESYRNPKYASQVVNKSVVIDDKIAISSATYNSYLTPHTEEKPTSYLKRKETAVYLNLVEPIISAYVSPLEQVKRNYSNDQMNAWLSEGVDFYSELDYPSFIKFVAEQTALFGHVFVVMDHTTDEAGNVLSIKPLVLNPIQVKEVYLDETTLALAGVEWERADDTSIKVTREAFIIEKDEVTTTIPLKEGSPFPVRVVYFKKDMSKPYPYGISLVSDTAEIGRKIYNLASWLDEVAKNTGFPFLALPTNKDAGEIPTESKIAVGTANAVQYPASSGAPQYVETSGQSTDQLRQMIKDEISKAFQTKGLNSFELVDSQAASGVSIKIRNNFFESKAKTFLQNIKALEKWIMDYISFVLELDTVEYSIMYPTNIVVPDAAAQIQNWITLLQTKKEFTGDVSNNLFVLVFEQILNQGFSLTEEQKKQIIDSITSNDNSNNNI